MMRKGSTPPSSPGDDDAVVDPMPGEAVGLALAGPFISSLEATRSANLDMGEMAIGVQGWG